MTTAYDAVTARIADSIVDSILVGDSVGSVCLGFNNTLLVSMTMMNHHRQAAFAHEASCLACGRYALSQLHLHREDDP